MIAWHDACFRDSKNKYYYILDVAITRDLWVKMYDHVDHFHGPGAFIPFPQVLCRVLNISSFAQHDGWWQTPHSLIYGRFRRAKLRNRAQWIMERSGVCAACAVCTIQKTRYSYFGFMPNWLWLRLRCLHIAHICGIYWTIDLNYEMWSINGRKKWAERRRTIFVVKGGTQSRYAAYWACGMSRYLISRKWICDVVWIWSVCVCVYRCSVVLFIVPFRIDSANECSVFRFGRRHRWHYHWKRLNNCFEYVELQISITHNEWIILLLFDSPLPTITAIQQITQFALFVFGNGEHDRAPGYVGLRSWQSGTILHFGSFRFVQTFDHSIQYLISLYTISFRFIFFI